MANNTARFCDGLPAYHCLVAGPSGSGKSWLLWEATLLAGEQSDLSISFSLMHASGRSRGY